MSPVIKDARRQEHVYDMTPTEAAGPGPIERSQVSAARMADFAAERAAAAATDHRLRRSPTTFAEDLKRSRQNGAETRRLQPEAKGKASPADRTRLTVRDDRAASVLEALELYAGDPMPYTRVGQELGMRPNVVAVIARNERNRRRVKERQQMQRAEPDPSPQPEAAIIDSSAGLELVLAEPAPYLVAFVEWVDSSIAATGWAERGVVLDEAHRVLAGLIQSSGLLLEQTDEAVVLGLSHNPNNGDVNLVLVIPRACIRRLQTWAPPAG